MAKVRKKSFVRLIEMGVEEIEARRMVEIVEEQEIIMMGRDQLTFGSSIRALLGGIIAAILGGIAWGLIVIATKYEIGFVAWGIGILSGYGVTLMARGKKGIVLKIMAVFSSILGILVGKYMTYYTFVNGAIAIEYGEEAAAAMFSIYSLETVGFFIREISYMFGVLDIVFVLLAITTAWKIPQDNE